MNIITTDNYTYHLKINKRKIDIVDSFISSKNDIKSILDIGCNSCVLSYKYNDNYDVTGMDLSTREELKIPDDYNFLQHDISTIRFSEKKYDLIYFLSVYHHLLGKYGLKYADKIFYRILLQSKYLLFDVGNTSEIHRREQNWFVKQYDIFENEKELLDHFDLPYKILGKWDVAGGVRTIVVFESEHFYENMKISDTYKRLNGSKYRDEGLIKESNWSNIEETNVGGLLYHKRLFHKVNIGSHYFFAKEINATNPKEYENTISVYECNEHKHFPFFFGKCCFDKKDYLLFEWIDDLKFKKTVTNLPNDTHNKFSEMQLFVSNGNEYYLDFER